MDFESFPVNINSFPVDIDSHSVVVISFAERISANL
jgi:hypothetical protein